MPRRRTTIIVTSIGVVAVAALGVGAFVFVDSMNGSFRLSSGSAAAAEKTPPATSTPTLKVVPVGGVLDEETALDLRREMSDNGDFAYKLPDGRWVKTNRFQPLPDAVKADADAQAVAMPRTSGSTWQEGAAGTKNADDTAGRIQFATGKKTVIISTQLKAAEGIGNAYNVPTYAVNGAITPGMVAMNGAGGWGTVDEAVAAVQADIAAQPDANNYLLVVQP
ncbi:hypothetical protein [Leifsonia sp. fls2-241-R2A-40a]|uniref:hypothetical protein n=1 Tax=Leifsonia sp. fls2-241-R2A-40a TaxID=3040290 RepID=UPI00254AEFC1|nr:hypothetical protein [Leifsonia sp. fls2-241-R2A-40a]